MGKHAVPQKAAGKGPPPFAYEPVFQVGPDDTTEYKKLTGDCVSTVHMNGRDYLQVCERARPCLRPLVCFRHTLLLVS